MAHSCRAVRRLPRQPSGVKRIRPLSAGAAANEPKADIALTFLLSSLRLPSGYEKRTHAFAEDTRSIDNGAANFPRIR
jgi:hypothetical protein